MHGQVESVLFIDLNISLLISNQEESHLRRLLWVRAEFLYIIGHWPLYLSQFKLCGLELSAGAVFINLARHIQTQMSTQLNGLIKGI